MSKGHPRVATLFAQHGRIYYRLKGEDELRRLDREPELEGQLVKAIAAYHGGSHD